MTNEDKSPTRDRPYDELMAEYYRDEPWFAFSLFLSLLRDGERCEWVVFWRHVRLVLRRRSAKTGA